MKKMKKLAALALAGVMMLSAVACGSKEEAATGSGESAAKETITFGTNAEFPPFEYVTSSRLAMTWVRKLRSTTWSSIHSFLHLITVRLMQLSQV